ncbi:MAG TPA: cytochrome P450 [Acidimicrobiales bacterium]|nr:cytochrome P450 [Acidimicrobiales bacterium]
MAAARAGLPVLDFGEPEVWREPALTARPMLEAGERAAWVPGFETVAALRWADCSEAIADHRRLGNIGSRYFELQGWTSGAFVDWTRRNVVMVDPPTHTRLRGLVNRAFTPKRVQAMEASTAATAHRLCDEALARGSLEFVHEWARLLPLHVIVELLGVPSVDTDRMGEWAAALSAAAGMPTPEARITGDDAMRAFNTWVAAQIDERRAEPRDDLLTSLIDAEESGERLDADELIAMVVQLIFAGHETTQNLLGNLLYRLLDDPAALRALRADRSLIANAIEESLRLDPPIFFTSRIAHEDVEVAGVTIPTGHLVVLLLAAANVDPTRVEDPWRFDAQRADPRHLSFGWGIHHCLGANLARLEGRVAVRVLLERFGSISFATDDRADWTTFTPLRGRQRLDVLVNAGGG